LKDYSLPELEQMLYNLCHHCEKADGEFIKAENDFELLNDVKSIVFEQLVEKQPEGKTNLREHNARLSDEWIEWIKTYGVIRYEKKKAGLKRDKYRREYTTCQMILSTRKAELKTLLT